MKRSFLQRIKKSGLAIAMAGLLLSVPQTALPVFADELPRAVAVPMERDLPVGGESIDAKTVIEEIEVNQPQLRRNLRSINLFAEDSVFVKGVSTNGKDALRSENQQDMYAAIDTAARNFMNSQTDLVPTNMLMSNGNGGTYYEDNYVIQSFKYDDFGVSKQEAYEVYMAYDYDHPAYYWISNSVLGGDTMIFLVTNEEYASVSTRATINGQIVDGVKEYVELAENGDSTLDKIALVHDKIVLSVDYAYAGNTTEAEEAKWAHSVQGVFDPEHKKVVCEGYADVFQLIMNCMEIPNYRISGTAGNNGPGGGGGHAWNAVSDDGGNHYMYMDLTWDDDGENGFEYSYFGMPQTDFERSHTKKTSAGALIEWHYDTPGPYYDSLEDTYYVKAGYYYTADMYNAENSTFDYSATKALINNAKARTYRLSRNLSILVPDSSGSDNYWGRIYTLSECNNIDGAGALSVSYEGVTYWAGIFPMSNTLSLEDATVSLSETGYSYNGSAITPEPVVTLNGVKLIKDLNYTLSYSNNIGCGDNATVTVTGTGNFEGSKSATFSIIGTPISASDVSLSAASFVYNGSSQKPTVTVGDLTVNTDYTVSFSNDTTNVGTVTVTVTGNGGYYGTVTKTYTITPASITGYQITLASGTYTYDGQAKRPEVTSVKAGNSATPLTAGTDYTVGYSNNINAGTATVTVTGKGNYKDSCSTTFTISSANISSAEMSLSQTSYVCDGTAKEPVPTLTFNGKTLTVGTDYTVEYSNNTAVGTATATASGSGNYTGTKSATFTISAQNIADRTITLSQDSYTFDGTEKTPSVTIKNGNTSLTLNTDYKLTYAAGRINVGKYGITITGLGRYVGTQAYREFTIEAANVSLASGTFAAGTYTYDGQAKTPALTVKMGDKLLVENTDYTLAYSDNVAAGTNAKATITGKGNYTGTKTFNFTIAQKSLSAATVNVASGNYSYTGSAIEPAVTVSLGGKTLSSSTDYTVSYSNNTDAGTATATVTGKGNYTGSCSKSFSISAANISSAEMTLSKSSFTYDGTAKKPEPTLTFNGKTLTVGTDYTLSYSNNTEIGTGATVTATGKGNFTGTKSVTFSICDQSIADMTITLSQDTLTYDGTQKAPSVTIKKGDTTLIKNTDYELTYADGRTDAGTYRITITGKGTYAGSDTYIEFTIEPANVSSANSIYVGGINTYDGTQKTPGFEVYVKSKKLVEGKDYTIGYSDNVAAGTNAKATITGKGNYTGTKTFNFTIEPKSLSAATVNVAAGDYSYTGSAIEPAVTVSLGGKTLSASTDYTVSYSNNTDAGIATVTVTGKGNYKGSAANTFEIKAAQEPEPDPDPDPNPTPGPNPTPNPNQGPEPEPTPVVETTPRMELNDNKLVVQTGKTSKMIKADLANDTIKSVTVNKSIADVKFSGDTIIVKAGKKAGKAKVTVTSASGIERTFSLEVQKAKVSTKTLTIKPGTKKYTLTGVGQTRIITAKATPDYYSTKEKITAKSNKAKVAEAKADYLTGVVTITAKAKGTANVTISAGKKKQVIKITVKTK